MTLSAARNLFERGYAPFARTAHELFTKHGFKPAGLSSRPSDWYPAWLRAVECLRGPQALAAVAADPDLQDALFAVWMATPITAAAIDAVRAYLRSALPEIFE